MSPCHCVHCVPHCPRSKFVSLEFSDDQSSDRIFKSIQLCVELVAYNFVKVEESEFFRKIQSRSRIRKTNKVHCHTGRLPITG